MLEEVDKPWLEYKGGFTMRKLVRVRKVLEEAEDEGLDPEQIYVDPDDIVELEEEPEED